jgi:CheY-like chemotaxis protein
MLVWRWTMSSGFKYRVLVADHDEALLQSALAALSREGYLVCTARDGFQALAELQGAVPDVIVSSLEMPNMSGFEFLAVVRQRFPSVGVIARSSEFRAGAGGPEGVLADRFIRDEENFDFELVEAVHELLPELPIRAALAKPELAPTWIPRSSTGYVVITCPSCLRSSTVRTGELQTGVAATSSCIHCHAEIKYRLDNTSTMEGDQPFLHRQQMSVESSRRAIDQSKHMIAESKARVQE